MAENSRHDPKIPPFNNLEEGYRLADELAHKIRSESRSSTAFQSLRDLFAQQSDPDSARKCQLELEIQEYVLVDGLAKAKYCERFIKYLF